MSGQAPRESRPARPALFAVAAIAVCTLIGIVVLWPGDFEPPLGAGVTAPTETAEVTEIRAFACPPPRPGDCATAAVRLTSGPESGTETPLEIGTGPLSPQLRPGEEIRVTRSAALEPGRVDASYSFADYERSGPMLWLVLAFVALVLVLGRVRGALSLLGLAVSLAILLVFIVPAILDGSSPAAVALVGSLAVMLATISLAHGLGAKSVAAILGTSICLLLVVGLALAFTELAHLTGVASEEVALIGTSTASISFQGLLVAGMAIGALGVLDDLTVSQASTVIALRTANPSLGVRDTYRRALAVGRDHVSATVNTLVLAYAGASLPILLLFSSGEIGFLDTVETELVATEVVAILVGSIGLIAAVPITTLIAAWLSSRHAAEA